jgi:CSLREA domain-containing protein
MNLKSSITSLISKRRRAFPRRRALVVSFILLAVAASALVAVRTRAAATDSSPVTHHSSLSWLSDPRAYLEGADGANVLSRIFGSRNARSVSAPVPFAACTWTGITSTDWATGTNWSGCTGGGTPQSGDTVSIGVAANQPTVSSAFGSVGAITISSGGTLTIASGGSLSSTATMAVSGGNLLVTGGAITVGNSPGGAINLTSSGTLSVSGGTLNISGRLTSTVGSVTVSSGSVNLCTVGQSDSSTATFDMGASTNLSISGGTITFQNANASTGGDLKITSGGGTKSITAGTFQIGNASTPASQIFKLNSPISIFNLTINDTNSPTGILDTTALTANGSITINSGGTLNANSLGLGVKGDWSNSGTFTPGSQVTTFNGSSPQSISGSSTTGFNGMTISSGATVNLSTGFSVTGTANVIGTLNCGTSIVSGAGGFSLGSGGTLGIGDPNGITDTDTTATGGNIRVSGARSFAANANYTYNGSAAQVTGNGLPDFLSLSPLTINNSAGVTLSQPLSTSSLILTNGPFANGSNLTLNGATVTRAAGSLASIPTVLVNLSLSYIGSTAVTTGPEVVAANLLATISVSNTAGVTLGGDLTVSGSSGSVSAGGILNSGAFTFSNANAFANNGTINVDSGGKFSLSGSFTNSGTVNVNGSFQINGGVSQAGNNYVYGASSTLIFNSSGVITVSGTPVYWPTSNGPANVAVQGPGGGISMSIARTVSGLFQCSKGVANANNLTLNGTSQVNAGGFMTGSPTYGSSSLLKYNTGTTYGPIGEWLPNITSGAGYPHDVQVSNNTTLNLPGSGTALQSFQLGGSLTIDSGSALTMTPSSGSNAQSLTVIGNLTNSGTLSQSTAGAGALTVGGNLTTTTYNSNGRTLTFNGGAAQNWTDSTGGQNFGSVVINNSSTGVTLNSAINCQTLTLTNGKLTTSASNLLAVTNTTTGAVSAGSASSYVNGPLNRTLPASLASGSTYSFPVGKSGFNPFELVNPTTTAGGTVSFTAEEFDGNSTGAAGAGLLSLNTDRYWGASITSGSGNFTNTQVKLTNSSALSGNNRIGKSATANGTYVSMGGTVSGSTITSDPITSFSFFNIGTGSSTISGTVFDASGNPITTGRTIKLIQNGTLSGTTATSNGSGIYTFTGLTLLNGDKITVYIGGATEKGATFTFTGTSDITTLNIYQNQLVVRSDNGSTVTNADLKTAQGASPDADLLSVDNINPSNILMTPAGFGLQIWSGTTYAPAGDINNGGNWINNGTFTAGSNIVTFNGTNHQTIKGLNSTTFHDLVIANTGTDPNNVVSLDGSAGATSTVVTTLTITNGVFDQGTDSASSDLLTGGVGQCVVVRPGKTWRNRGRGDETLSCDVHNEGTIEFNAVQQDCGDADEILIRSSVPGTQRTWEGSGTFSMTDVDVRDQTVPGGSLLPLQILVNSGTGIAQNNTGWTFNSTCTGPYTWIGGSGQRWADDVNWSPIRADASAGSTSDVLIFDGSVTPTTVVEDVQSQTNSAIRLQNGVIVILHANIGGATLVLNGATGNDLDVPANTLLTLAGAQKLIIELTAPTVGGTVPAGHVAGQLIMRDDKHQLSGDNAGEIIFTGANALTIDSTYSATTHPFGEGTSGSVIFQSGATGVFGSGLDPLGGAGKSVVTFNEGSTAHFFATTALLGDAGTYGNLILDGVQDYLIAGSSQITILNDLEIDLGSTFLLSSTPGADLNLYGNFIDKTTIARGFNPNTRVVKFLGATQTVSKAGGGIAGFDGVLINQSPGGKVQLLSPTDIGQLNLSTANALLELNGQVLELVGTVTGPGNLKGDPSAILAASGNGDVGTVNFVSGGRNLSGLLLNRGTNGAMTLGTDLGVAGTLRLDNGILNTGVNTLSLSSTSPVLRTNGYVIGNLQKSFGASGNLGSFTFPLGTANAYSPLDANVTANTNGTLTATAVQGKQPNIAGANALQRYWTLSGSGITTDLTFHYRGGAPATGDVVGNEAIYKILKYNGSFTQVPNQSIDTGAHTATVTGVSSFSDWTLAEPAAIATGTLQFSATNFNDTELNSSSHTATITVTRTGGSTGPASVHWATSAGTATAGTDYTEASGDLNWIDGDATSKQFTVTVFGDTTYEANETVNLTLSAAAGATLGTPNPATLTIVNDDNPPANLVVNTNDDQDFGACLPSPGHCSLREAINAANAVSDASTISFNIAGAGVHTITPATALPAITQPVTIDGYSQPSASANTSASGNNAVLLIVLNGGTVGTGGDGLTISAGSSTVKGLVINGGFSRGIVVGNGGNTVTGNFIGTDAAGTGVSANLNGIQVTSASNFIGGTNAADRNVVIAQSTGTGILVNGSGANSNTIQGNHVGTNALGTAQLGTTGTGIRVDTSTNTIGGTTGTTAGGACTGACNLASGNTNSGIAVFDTAGGAGNTIQGNFVGTNAAGTAAIGNGFWGVQLQTSGTLNVLGGTTAAARNVISGNVGIGIVVQGADQTTIQGNYIGVDTTGAALGNGVSIGNQGIVLGASNCTIGGLAAGAGNIIANNNGAGILVAAGTNPATGNSIRGNSFFSNARLGIDLSGGAEDANGVTANDNKDPDTGPNNLQNFPVLTSAFVGGTSVGGTLNSTVGATVIVDVYSNDACDLSGDGEGKTYLGSVTTGTTDINGDVSFTVTVPALVAGKPLTATATDSGGNTSEFSLCLAPATTQTISGTVFTTNSVGTMPAGRTITLLQNGVSAGTGTTDASGNYSISGVTLVSGDKLAVFIDNAAEKGAAVTLSGTSSISNLNIIQNALIVRTDNGGTITNANLSAAQGGGPDADLTAVYSVATGNLTTPVGVSLELWSGSNYTPGGNITDGGDWINNANVSAFTPGAFEFNLNGNANQSIGGTSNTTFNTLKISNTGTSPNNVVSQTATNDSVSTLNINSGVFSQGTSGTDDFNLTTGAATVAAGATWRNLGKGDLTLSGNVSNSGTINFNANGTPCGDADSILIRSSIIGTQRTWSGTGTFSMTDVDVKDQTTPALTVIVVNSGFDSGNNGTGWQFVSACASGTYTWIGGANQDWQVPTNWTPTRLAPNTSDQLIVDNSVTPSPVITNVPTQTIAKLTLVGPTSPNLQAQTIGPQILTISGATGDDLHIPAGATLYVSNPTALKISIPSGSGASVTGQIVFQDGPHEIVGAAANSILFHSGAFFTNIGTANPFGAAGVGDGVSGSAVFESGSSGFFNGGGDPFGGASNSQCVFNSGSTAQYSAQSAFAPSGRSYGNLNIAGVLAASGSSMITVLNNFTILSGGTLQLSSTAGGDLNLQGNFEDDNGAGAFDANGRTVKFQGGGTTQTILNASAEESFFDVFISETAGGKVQLLSQVSISHQLNLSTVDSVLELNRRRLTLNGTVTGTGNLKGDLSGAVLRVVGTGALGTLNFLSGARSLSRIEVARTSSGSVTLGNDLTVGTNLILTDGIVNMGTFTLTAGGTVSQTNGYVIGNVLRDFPGAGSFTFPVGTADGYSPVGANVTTGSFPQSFTVKAVPGKHPNISGTNALQRYWTIAGAGSLAADLTFNYLAGDVVGTESNYKIFRYNGRFTTATPDVLNTASHFATKNNAGPLSADWTLAEPAAVTPGTLAFFGAPYSDNETNANHNKTITVRRSGGSDGGVSVHYTTSAGSATAGVDYTETSGDLSWAAGDSADKTFDVPIVGDTSSEPNETVNLTLSAATGLATIDAPNPTTLTITDDDADTGVAVSGGNLVLTDVNGGTTDDTLTISRNGSNVRINDPNHTLSCAGGVLVDAHTCDVPLSSITGSMQVNSSAGSDTLTLDLGSGNFFPPGGITFNGGDPTTSPGDKLIITGGVQGTVTYNYTNAHDGSVVMQNFGTVTYTGLEPISNSGTATDLVFNLPSAVNVATLSDLGSGNSRLGSTGTFEQTDFTNPSGSVTINGGSLNDSISVGALAASYPSLTINGNQGNDTVNFTGSTTFGAAASLDVNLQNDDPTPGIDRVLVNGQLVVSAAGKIDIRTSQDVTVNSGGKLQVENGNLTVEGNQPAISNATNHHGVDINGGTIQSTGTGNISVKGQGGEGAFIEMYGVYVWNGGKILSTGTGTITVEGTGGARTGGAIVDSQMYGVYVYLPGSEISSTSAAMTINGFGGATNATGSYGVVVGGGKIQQGGVGTLTINGTGGTCTGGIATTANSIGVAVVPDDTATPAGGIVTSTGTGVNAGNISITGVAGNGGNGGSQGVRVDAPGTVTTVDGSLTFNGTGGAGPISSLGISIRGAVTATGIGAINLTGTGANASGGAPTHGVNVRGGGAIKAKDGNITITGTGGNGTDNAGFNLAPVGTPGTGTIQTTGAGNIFINADIITIQTTALATIDAGVHAVSFRQKTNTIPINLGSTVDTTASTVELSNAELGRVTSGTLNIGDNNSGAITVSADITRAASTNMSLTSGGDIVISGGQVNTGGGTLLLDCGNSPAAVKPTKSGTDVTASTLSFGSDLAIVINGTTVDTQYNQLKVVGIVDVTGVTLKLSGSHIPVAGQTFTIVDNDGTSDGVVSTFNGLSEGAIIPNFLGSAFGAKITYVGGDGNDVVLTVVATTDVSVAVSPASVLENGATNLDYTFTRSGNTTGTLTVNFSVGGTATFATDYTQTGAATFGATSGTVTFTGTNTTAVVTIDPTADTDFEASETVVLTVTSGAGYNPVAPTSATGTITNDDSPSCTTLTVNDTGDAADATPGDGTCATAGTVCTLRAAIMEANALTSCGTIDINFSLTLPNSITLGSALDTIGHNVNINGPGADQLVIDGNDTYRIFVVGSGRTVTIDGLVLAYGFASGVGENGAGVLNNGDLTVTNSIIASNQTPNSGAGIYNNGGTLTIRTSTFVDQNFSVSGPATQNGGAIYNNGSVASATVNIINSTFNGNFADNSGGAVMNDGASATMTITNSTISQNGTFGDAGGIRNNGGTVNLRNTIVGDNFSIDTDHYDVFGTFVSLGHNLISVSDGSTGFGISGDQVGSIDAPLNPGLEFLGNNGGTTPTMALRGGSPAIDAGDDCVLSGCSPTVTTDQRGVTRPQGAHVDIGAYEIVTYVVNTTSDHATDVCEALSPGHDCTLREAIDAANLSPGSRIAFAIPTGVGGDAGCDVSGVCTISPTLALGNLPSIPDAVFIDGYSQPGASQNTKHLDEGDDAVLKIVLDGSNITTGGRGLDLVCCGGGSVIRGLVINHWTEAGIAIADNGGNTIAGNFIGVDVAGTTSAGNANASGILITGESTDNNIGGDTPDLRNVISGNGNGIVLDGELTTDTVIEGNYIGTNRNGTAIPTGGGSSIGVKIQNGSNFNTIGCEVLDGDNVISGNTNSGVRMEGDPSFGGSANFVQGNLIGTDRTGAAAVPNGIGVVIVDSTENSVGVNFMGTFGNLISGNTGDGVLIQDSTVSGNFLDNFVQSNLIGTNAAGTAALANGGAGVELDGAAGNLIGGATTNDGNLISGNTGDGVEITGGASTNDVQGNLIGVAANGTTLLGNGGSGVEIYTVAVTAGSSDNIIGEHSVEVGTKVRPGSAKRAVNRSERKPGARSQRSGKRASVPARFANRVKSQARAALSVALSVRGPRVTTLPSIGNTSGSNIIAGNGVAGIRVSNAPDVNNLITENSIHSNTGLGIDLGTVGVTANDPDANLDSDDGSNHLQNFPILQTARQDTQTITGILHSAASSDYTIEFYANPACDGSGFGEGKTFIGSTGASTDGSGNAPFSFTALPGSFVAGNVITATATDSVNNTSEFSQCFTALAGAQPTTTTITNAAALAVASTVGNPYEVDWSVTPSGSGTPTGTVSVTGDGAGCSAAVSAGKCFITPTTSGVKTLVAHYGGDPDFSPSDSAPVSHTVNDSGISGHVDYCITPTANVPNVTISVTGSQTTSTTTDSSGNYSLSLPLGGNYTLTPSKSALSPAAAGIDTVDALSAQSHYVGSTTLTGCPLLAADVTENSVVDTVDAVAIQRFFVGLNTGIASTGQYRFTPANRTYSELAAAQTGQNFDAVVLGDINGNLTPTKANLEVLRNTIAANVTGPSSVATVSLPVANVSTNVTNFTQPVTTSTISAGDNLVGFQGDFTFDSTVVTFQSPPVTGAGLTGGAGWSVTGNVLGAGTIKTLRVSAFTSDFGTPLSGSGTLFNLKLTRVSNTVGANTPLIWAASPNNFVFIASNLSTQPPDSTPNGSITIVGPSAANGDVSGRILDANGNPVEGAGVRMSGSQNRLTVTDANGNYNFTNVETNGFYTVTPARANFSFSPAQRSFSQLGLHSEAAFTGVANSNTQSPLDRSEYFVRQQYLDFLNREPDEAGLNFWVNNIESCGADAQCREVKRIDTSAAFFLSIEFQQTGYLVYRTYHAAFGEIANAPVPLRLSEFQPDSRAISRGVIVTQGDWERTLESNKQEFMTAFVGRARFNSAYPATMTPAEFVDKLFANAGVAPSTADRDAAVNEFAMSTTTGDMAARASALRRVAENAALAQKDFDSALVLMQYFGYLRRDADSTPDMNFDGYNFWLTKLNTFKGNYQQAELVKAFLSSNEYRGRFPR